MDENNNSGNNTDENGNENENRNENQNENTSNTTPMKTRGQEKKELESSKKRKIISKNENESKKEGTVKESISTSSNSRSGSTIRIDWSDGSYATVGKRCGRLMR